MPNEGALGDQPALFPIIMVIMQDEINAVNEMNRIEEQQKANKQSNPDRVSLFAKDGPPNKGKQSFA